MKLTVAVPNKENEYLYKNKKNFNNDAGYDLYCTEDVIIQPGETGKIKTGIVGIPFNHNQAYMLFPRSSIYKTRLRMANSVGLIDGGYRGEIMGMMDNIGNSPVHVKKGDRFLQLVAFDGKPMEITLHFGNPEMIEGYESSRKTGGFGSTN